MTRTAEEIGRTATGPRQIPPMTLTTRTRAPSVTRAELDTGLAVVAVRKPRSPLVEVRLRIPFAGTTRKHAAAPKCSPRRSFSAPAHGTGNRLMPTWRWSAGIWMPRSTHSG